MDVSIIICTCNRSEILKETLDSITCVQVPDSMKAELIVVDNASTDDTRKVVESVELSQMSVRYVYEPKRGQCHARNAGMAQAKGEVFLWTDDDVEPDSQWLIKHVECYENKKIAAVLGKIELHFDTEAPEWLTLLHREMIAETHYGDSLIFPFSKHLIGANMSFHRRVFSTIGGFNPMLGPGQAGFWDDSEFSIRLMSAGLKQCYQPEARVHHQIASQRLTREYFMDAAFRQGVSIFIATRPDLSFSSQHMIYDFLRNSAKRLKWNLKNGCKPRLGCSEAELSHQMGRGYFSAYRRGFEDLKKHYDV